MRLAAIFVGLHRAKFPLLKLTLTDWTGIVETELFAPTYRNYGLAAVRYLPTYTVNE